MSDMPRKWVDIRREWAVLSLYQRFEVLVALVLTFVIGLIAAVALYRLVAGVVDTLLLRALNPLDHSVFQKVFGEINGAAHRAGVQSHPAPRHHGERGIVHTKMVILSALLALARKIIITDLYELDPASAFLILPGGDCVRRKASGSENGPSVNRRHPVNAAYRLSSLN